MPDPNAFTGEVKITRAAGLAKIRQELEWEIVLITGARRAGTGRVGHGTIDPLHTQHLASGEPATTCSTSSCPSRKRSNPTARSRSPARSSPSRSCRRIGTRSRPRSKNEERTARRASADEGHAPRYLPSVSKQRVAQLWFGATFAIAAFSLGLQFVQDWLGVWDDPGNCQTIPGHPGMAILQLLHHPSQPARGGDPPQSCPEARS